MQQGEQTDAQLLANNSPTLLGIVASVCTQIRFDRFQTVCATTPNSMQQGEQTDATLLEIVASVCTQLKV